MKNFVYIASNTYLQFNCIRIFEKSRFLYKITKVFYHCLIVALNQRKNRFSLSSKRGLCSNVIWKPLQQFFQGEMLQKKKSIYAENVKGRKVAFGGMLLGDKYVRENFTGRNVILEKRFTSLNQLYEDGFLRKVQTIASWLLQCYRHLAFHCHQQHCERWTSSIMQRLFVLNRFHILYMYIPNVIFLVPTQLTCFRILPSKAETWTMPRNA